MENAHDIVEVSIAQATHSISLSSRTKVSLTLRLLLNDLSTVKLKVK